MTHDMRERRKRVNCAMFNALHSLYNTKRIISARHIDTVSMGKACWINLTQGCLKWLKVGYSDLPITTMVCLGCKVGGQIAPSLPTTTPSSVPLLGPLPPPFLIAVSRRDGAWAPSCLFSFYTILNASSLVCLRCILLPSSLPPPLSSTYAMTFPVTLFSWWIPCHCLFVSIVLRL